MSKPNEAMIEKVARAISIPQHHTGWDSLTSMQKDLFYMQADYAIKALATPTNITEAMLPLGSEFIDAAALERMRLDPEGGRDGHDMAGVNWNTAWRMVATIDALAARIARNALGEKI